ncbi:Regulator of nonsense-mediated decay [Macleaya cordata]|uniref:Regulator of nonsense-mediated decay n=1 Tax=Macleaya cordata TaxID=56857 RepID=A0A200Q2U9_MACCD|nr:Regulator of nonsense-mediated decay [Macleaya cordata]
MCSHKHQQYSRAYIDFKKPDDVVEFAEFFDGHVFVNEKGTQFKAIVEYSPSQRVPKPWSKKDGREGTIFKDPEYLEFLELLAKPVENLPSAEIQLERREAERAGAPKEAPIVTPLMDFVRQKRAAKSGPQRSSSNGKLNRRAVGASSSNSRSTSSKRSSEKKRASTSMYVQRDSAKNASGKEKSTYILVPRRENQQLSDKSTSVAAATGSEIVDDEIVPSTDGAISGASGAVAPVKKKVLLLKGKEREIAHATGSGSQPSVVNSPVKNSSGAPNFKQIQRREASGKIIRSILSNKEAQTEQQIQSLNLEKDKRPPRPMRSVLKDSLSSNSQAACSSDCDSKRASDDKVIGSDLHGFGSSNEKQEKRTRNKDRPDRGVWTLRRSDGSHASDDSLSSSSSLATQVLSDSVDGITITQHVPVHGVSKPGDDVVDTEFNNKSSSPSGKPRNLDTSVHNTRYGRGVNSSSAYDLPLSNAEMKVDMPSTSRSGEVKTFGGGRSSYSSVENGSHRHTGRRGPAHAVKDVEGSMNLSDGKPSKRGGAASYGSHESNDYPNVFAEASMGSEVGFGFLVLHKLAPWFMPLATQISEGLVNLVSGERNTILVDAFYFISCSQFWRFANRSAEMQNASLDSVMFIDHDMVENMRFLPSCPTDQDVLFPFSVVHTKLGLDLGVGASSLLPFSKQITGSFLMLE